MSCELRADAPGQAPLQRRDRRKGRSAGKKVLLIGGDQLDFVDGEGTDFSAVQQGLISITPLHLDLTNYTSLTRLQGLRLRWP